LRIIIYYSGNFKFPPMRPIHAAAELGHKEVVSLLLERGADIEAKTRVRDSHSGVLMAGYVWSIASLV
jgi:hypothetical protein